MKLRDYLLNNELSQTEFADMIGVTRAAVSNWICNARVPKPRLMRAIMQATGDKVRRRDFQNGRQP